MSVIDYGPALREKSKHYPARFKGRTPKTIRMLQTVVPDWPVALADPSCRDMRAEVGQEYQAHTNTHGAVCAHLPDGKQIGLKPHEFKVVEWFAPDGVTVTRDEPAPEVKWTGGPMSLERAREISRAIVEAAMPTAVDGDPPDPLPRCTLEEMLIATRIMDENSEQRNADGTTTLTMRVDPRFIAAMYAFQHYGCDPRALLAAVGFSITEQA